jgi:histone chaperone ASF1
MAKVQLTNVTVLDNPSPFMNPFQFEITFDCIEDLPNDLEFKIIYVGSASSKDHDQVLDSVLVGPVPAGRHMFVFQADGPKTSLIPQHDAVGVTVVLLTASYLGQEFTRVGYYVNNEYTDPEMRENPPSQVQFEQLQRNILASSPRVTRFKIDWEGSGKDGWVDQSDRESVQTVGFGGNLSEQEVLEQVNDGEQQPVDMQTS